MAKSRGWSKKEKKGYKFCLFTNLKRNKNLFRNSNRIKFLRGDKSLKIGIIGQSKSVDIFSFDFVNVNFKDWCKCKTIFQLNSFKKQLSINLN